MLRESGRDHLGDAVGDDLVAAPVEVAAVVDVERLGDFGEDLRQVDEGLAALARGAAGLAELRISGDDARPVLVVEAHALLLPSCR